MACHHTAYSPFDLTAECFGPYGPTVMWRIGVSRAIGCIVVAACCSVGIEAAAQSQPPASPTAPPSTPPPGRGRGVAPPKAGVCPLPILPALPPEDDTAFFAHRAVPH